jgi:hypothetical protein
MEKYEIKEKRVKLLVCKACGSEDLGAYPVGEKFLIACRKCYATEYLTKRQHGELIESMKVSPDPIPEKEIASDAASDKKNDPGVPK